MAVAASQHSATVTPRSRILPAWMAPLLLAALGLAIYANSFTVPFVYDGVRFIVENDDLRGLNPFRYTSGQTRPISYWSFAVNVAIGGHKVFWFHAVNLAIHVLAACALFGLVRRTLEESPRCRQHYAGYGGILALAVATLWLVHPLQTASITYIYQRQESLMGLFYLTTLYCVVRAIQACPTTRAPSDTPDAVAADASLPQRSPVAGIAWQIAAVVFALLGMGTKEVMVTCPFVALWYDRVFWAASWQEIRRRRLGMYLALAASGAVLFVVLLIHKEKYQSVGLMVGDRVPPLKYALNQPAVICHYLYLCINPRYLCLDPNWQVRDTAAELLPGIACVAVLVGLTLWCVWRYPALGFVAGVFFVILSPTSSLLPILDLACDHRMYLSLASVLTLAVLGCFEMWRRAGSEGSPLLAKPLLPALVLAAVVLVFSLETVVRNFDYRKTIDIWADTVEKTPHNARARYSLARDLHTESDDPKNQENALYFVNEALERVPTYPEARNLRRRGAGKSGTSRRGRGRLSLGDRVLSQRRRCLDQSGQLVLPARQLRRRIRRLFAGDSGQSQARHRLHQPRHGPDAIAPPGGSDCGFSPRSGPGTLASRLVFQIDCGAARARAGR